MEGTETTEPAEEIVEREQTSDGQSVDSIFSDALKEKVGTPEDAEQTEASETESQPQTPEEKQENKELYAELVVGGAQKFPFKTEEEFQKFLEANPKLKEGFMRQADYTRKTMQVAEEKKNHEKAKQEHEEQVRGELELWGGEKPDQNSLKALGDVWQAFRHGSPQLIHAINSFVSDIQMIVAGKNPTGPLAGNVQFGESDSRLLGLKREFENFKRESTEKEKKFNADRDREARQKAVSQLNAFESELSQKGIKIERDEFMQMSHFGHLVGKPKLDAEGNPTEETYTFHDAYKAALGVLGRSEKLAVKKVFAKSEEVKKSTPRMPTSKAPANAQPHANNLDAIFEEGLQKLKE